MGAHEEVDALEIKRQTTNDKRQKDSRGDLTAEGAEGGKSKNEN
jgi:hypothetical protein